MNPRLLISVASLIAVTSFAAPGPSFDVSKIIDQATAEAILESKVKPAVPRNLRGGDGYYSKCNYYSRPPGRTLLIRVYRAAEGYDPNRELDSVKATTPALRELNGLGDKAVVTDGTASALSARALMLYVIKGNTLVTVGVSGIDDGTAALNKAKSVAEKIVAHL